MSKAGDMLIPYIEKPYLERAFFANKNVKFVLATLGNDAGICGAAKLVLGDRALRDMAVGLRYGSKAGLLKCSMAVQQPGIK